MARPGSKHPTEGELTILKVLWDQGPTRLSAICESLSVNRKTAPSTVATMLKIMKNKGLVKRVASDRGVVWQAELSQEKAGGGMLQSLMSRLFDGSASNLVMHLLERGDLSQTEQDEIRGLLESRHRQKKINPK
jgi:BlaI family penicillinase repressor